MNCRRSFAPVTNLNNHMKTHHKIQQYVCSQCPKKYHTVTQLNHLGTHGITIKTQIAPRGKSHLLVTLMSNLSRIPKSERNSAFLLSVSRCQQLCTSSSPNKTMIHAIRWLRNRISTFLLRGNFKSCLKIVFWKFKHSKQKIIVNSLSQAFFLFGLPSLTYLIDVIVIKKLPSADVFCIKLEKNATINFRLYLQLFNWLKATKSNEENKTLRFRTSKRARWHQCHIVNVETNAWKYKQLIR